MKTINVVSFLVIFVSISYAQIPEFAFQPMTAPGTKGIHCCEHTLLWINPQNIVYNEVYFSEDSMLVAQSDPAVIILNGNPSTVFSSVPLSIYGTLNYHTKYFWKVVEYSSFGQTASPVYYFISRGPYVIYWEDFFENGISNYTMIQPPGASWSISNTSYAGGTSPELRFHNSTIFNDTSYLILNESFDLSPTWNGFHFFYSADWQYGEFIVGLAYSLDEGITWIPMWQQVVTEDIPSTQIVSNQVPNENYVKLAFFCISTNPSSAGYWYIDDFFLVSALTVSLPPAQIRAISDTSSQKVYLSWGPGYTVNPSWGYVIQRKNGLPISTSAYQEIGWVGPDVFSFEDFTVQLDSIYTYRIQSRSGPRGGFRSTWSNEATAYTSDKLTATQEENNTITEFFLYQNYPNPFNQGTIIKYDLPAAGNVSLKIYDIHGSVVKTVVNEEKVAGKYEVNFDASSFASGVYLYKLNVNDYVNTKKMILLK